ncbi:MAG: c-type cytochrome [Blastocatellia bacterium]
MNTAHSSPSPKHFRLALICILSGLLLLAACNQSASVVSNTPPAPAANVAASTPETTATPTATATATPSATPSVAPTAGAAASPAATAAAAPGADKNQHFPSLKTIAVTQPIATPKAEATPTPAPTPEIRRDGSGKIIQQWKAPAESARLTNPVAGKPEAIKFGQAYYEQRCADCHGKDGRGNGPMARMKGKQATNLASEVVQANTDGELFYKVTNTDKERLPHPKSEARFSDEQRWYIVAYLRTMKPGAKR